MAIRTSLFVEHATSDKKASDCVPPATCSPSIPASPPCRFAAPDLSATTADVSTYRLEVVVINLDGVLSTSKTATLTNS